MEDCKKILPVASLNTEKKKTKGEKKEVDDMLAGTHLSARLGRSEADANLDVKD